MSSAAILYQSRVRELTPLYS